MNRWKMEVNGGSRKHVEWVKKMCGEDGCVGEDYL